MNLPIKYNSLTQEEFVSLCKQLIPSILPEWTDTSDDDFGIALLRNAGVFGDILSNKIDVAFSNAFLSTCNDRDIAVLHATKYNYDVKEATPASVDLNLKVKDLGVIPILSVFYNKRTDTDDVVYFENLQEVTVTQDDVDLGYKTMSVTAGQSIIEIVGISDGNASQIFTGNYEGYLQKTIRVFVETGGVKEEWQLVSDWNKTDRDDKHFIIVNDKFSRISIMFGDGVNAGAIPPISSDISFYYRIGGGRKTNLPANTITEFDTSLTDIIENITHTACSGGSDRESLESIKKNTRDSLKALYRCVSMEDYEIMLRGFSGVNGIVKKVFAIQGIGFNVNIYAIGFGGSSISNDLKTEIIDYLVDKKIGRDNPVIFDLENVRLNIEMDIICSPKAVKTSVEERIRVLFGNNKNILDAYYDFDSFIDREEYTDLLFENGGGDPYYTCHQATLYSLIKYFISGIQSLEIKKLTIFPKDTLKVYTAGNTLSFKYWSEIEVLPLATNDSFIISFNSGNNTSFTVYKVSTGASVGSGTVGSIFEYADTFSFTINDTDSNIAAGDSFIFKTLPFLEDIGVPTNKIHSSLERMYMLRILNSFNEEELKINISGGI